jgi:CysZ protein
VIGELTRGIHDGMRGATYLARHPRLWRWVLAPAIVAAVVFVIAIRWILGLLSGPIDTIASVVPGSWAATVLHVAATIVLVVASATIFISVAALIAGPFNEMLSESIEEHVTGVPSPKFDAVRFVVDLAVGAVHAIRRIAVYLVTMAALLVVGLVVPVAGTLLAAIGGAIATASFASYDSYDAIWGRRRWRYRAKIAYLREHRWRTLGLGAVVAALLLVPGLNLVALSVGATGATLRDLEQTA